MRKSRARQSSFWTSDVNEEEVELGSQTNLISTKKKGLKHRDANLRDNDSSEARFKGKNTDNASDVSISINRSNGKEDTGSPPVIFRKRNLLKSDNIKWTDSQEPVNLPSTQSIDVVVDIHREHKENKSRQHENVETLVQTFDDRKDTLSQGISNAKIFPKSRVLRNRNNKDAKHPARNQRRKKFSDDIKIVDSLDLIEEFHEPSTENKAKEPLIESTTKNDHVAENIFQSSTEKKSHGRRQWDMPEKVDDVEDLNKPRRKRWTKDASIIHLPQNKSMSSTTSSIENVSSLDQDSEKPVPLTRSSLRKEPFFSFDNAGFVSEDEEVLRIETDHNQKNMKIEMKKMSDRFKDSTMSPSSDSQRGSIKEKKTMEDTVIPLAELNESENDSDRRYSVKDVKRMELKGEHSGDSDASDISSKRRTFTRKVIKNEKNSSGSTKSSAETSMSENSDVDVVSDFASSENELTNHDFPSKRGKVKNAQQNGKARSSGRKEKPSSEGKENRVSRKKEKKNWTGKSETMSSSRTQDSAGEEESKKKKKRRKKKKEENEESGEDIKYISITIHRADMLETDYITKHPMVKVHIVNAETGYYLRNTHDDAESKYLQPIITGKYDFKENRSMIPVWEEELIFEHDADSLLKTEKQQVVILFEIIDLLTFAEASFNYDRFGNEGCWYKVAWAFLKPVGRNNTLHTDKKVRLQLYRPHRDLKKFGRHKCEVYTWWKSSSRDKYPSSLFVTITSVDPPKLEPVIYQQLSLYDLSDIRSDSQKASTRLSESLHLSKWTRLAAQSCKIPNEKLFETAVSENGCFFVTFSNNGKYLACVFSEEYDYPILVYEVESKNIYVRFTGHKTFVYSLNWSEDDNYLLSVSSDQTARVWDVRDQIVQQIEMMPHPSYVYCGKFYPGNTSIVATGCCDRVIRIWTKDKKSVNRHLNQELEGHEGFINSMCFQKDGGLLTADSIGTIIVWAVKKNRRLSLRKEWQISKKIKVRDIEGVTINTIILHPFESRLLVHSRNNGLRMLDLATGVVLQKYTALNNQRIQSTACISPCGGLILCGGEDSSLNVWNLETGKYLARYTIERNFRAVTCVDYHPYDHVLAFSTFGSPAPVRVLRFNKDATGEDVGLQIFGENKSQQCNNDAISLLNTSVRSRGSRSSSRKRSSEELSPNRKTLSHLSRSQQDEDKCQSTMLKLHRLNEKEQTLKNYSASRLYNIIEKIDRILSNTSRSSDDVESGRNTSFIQKKSKRHSLKQDTDTDKEERISRKSKSSTLSNIEDHSDSYFESTTTISIKNEMLEFQTFRESQQSGSNVRKQRSKSAKEMRAKEFTEDECLKTFSDSAANSRKLQVYGEIMNTIQQETIESSFVIQPPAEENPFSKSHSFRKINCFASDHSDSPSSTGTYIVEKAEFERNNDTNSIKVTDNEVSVVKDTRWDTVKTSESESSVINNSSFIVENELPVPKPRRRKDAV